MLISTARVRDPDANSGGTVTGTGTATQVAFWDSATSITGDSNFYWDNTNKRLGVGTNTPSYQVDINGGTIGANSRAFNLAATIPNTTGSSQYGMRLIGTGSGTGTGFAAVLRAEFNSGYTGSTANSVLSFYNSNAGTGVLNSFAVGNSTPVGNSGFAGFSGGGTTGTNYGGYGEALNGNINIGLHGKANTAKNSAVNIGILGIGRNTGTSPTQIGGWFSLGNATPTWTSAALVADNGDQTSPILLLKDNGTTVVTVADGGNMTVGTTNAIVGTATNNDASAGNIGEYVSSFVAVGSAVSLTTATAANITSISLTAGDWDVEGHVNFTETTATVTARSAGTTSTSATIPTDGSEAYCGVQSTVTSEINSITPSRKRFSLSGTTTIYLVASATFSAGTCAGFGSLTARRVR